jgi:membrane protease YdiL (CAAX protease family)
LPAIGFAPAEEYLSRGLFYRALVGSAAFFAIYHPPMSRLPVGLLGLVNDRRNKLIR